MNNITRKILTKILNIKDTEYDTQNVWYHENCATWREFKREFGYSRVNFLYEIYSRIPFLEWLLHSLCELEMSFKLLFDKEFKRDLDTQNVYNKYTKTTFWQDNIPENDMYCSGCIFKDYSRLANFLFGDQSDGYCYHLGKGDFSYINPTELLWDGCKECGHSYFEGDDE